ncbi:MAG: MFS transporter [Caldilineae bacterium]|nr:MFS transporter [Anaerolineae bacterium]MCB0256391.1 MFS transporter [Anaerolineae bacterium]MCB9154053.1 MFS transporter [Caldilineae bacterium]
MYRNKWLILGAVSLALFMGTVDSTIVNVALPTMVADFNTNFPTIQWVVLAFLLGLSVLMLSVGRLADMLGKKRIFLLGLVIFTAGSALCGLSPTVYVLIAARLIQSIGAAMLLALGVAIVTETWPSAERGKALGFSAGVISLGIVVGPTAGGLIINALSWHWIFFVNVPLGLLALIAVWRYVPPLTPKSNHEQFDFLGAGVFAVGLLALLLGLTVGQTIGFGDPRILALFGLAAVSLVLFIAIEQRVRFPMVDLNLFRNLQFSLNLATGALTFVAIAAVVFLLPFYLELALSLPVAQVGILMASTPLVLAVLGPLSGSLSDRFGTRPVSVIGLAILTVGYLVASTMNATTTPLGFILRMLLIGVGMGVFQSPNNSAIMGAAPRNRLGIASGMLSITRTLGQTTGIALLGALFASALSIYAGQPTDISAASPEVISSALHDQFLLVAGLIGIGLVLALLAWRRERRAASAATVQPDAA